jgi:diguanylate cyclase (GGDEF)-like protein/PAS domain S-box-containing protein
MTDHRESAPTEDLEAAQRRELEETRLELERTVDELRRQLGDRHGDGEETTRSPSGVAWGTVVEHMPQIVWITWPDGWHTHFNRRWMDLTGLTLDESLGDGWLPAFHPADQPRAAARWAQAISTGEPYEIEYRLRSADGEYRWMLGRAVPLRDDSGTIVRWFGTCTDIQELKQAQARIDAQARLLDQTQDAILVHDLDDRRVLYWNQGAARIHGWTPTEAVGRRLDELVCPDPTLVEIAIETLLRDGEWSGELRCLDRTGGEVIMEGRWSLLRNDDGSPQAALAVNTDVTERWRIETHYLQALEARATQDPLTGLPNRAMLFDQLELLLEQRHRTGIAVAFIDLDDFKPINDRLGHRTGDRVLVDVAERLQATIRQGDVAARIGGDEFVVVGESEDERGALQLGVRLAAALDGTVDVDGTPVKVSASVGVAFVGRGDHSGADAILSRADATMYEVKRRAPGSAAVEQRDPPSG